MDKNMDLKGVLVPMISIFKDNEEVDFEQMTEHAEYLINTGVHGLIVNASTSEFYHLSIEERKNIASTIIKKVNGRIPVLIGTAACATREVIELSKHAEYIGSNGVMIVPPYYLPLNKDEICKHYQMVDKEIKIPIMVYNSPVVSYTNIDTVLISNILNATSNVKYLKDSSGSINNIQDILLKTNFNIKIFIGEEPIYLQSMYSGCSGMIPMIGNALPEIFIDFFNLFKNEEFIKARSIHYRILDLLNYVCFNSDGYCSISIIKSISKLRGRNVGTARKPVIPLPEDEEKKLGIILKKLDLI